MGGGHQNWRGREEEWKADSREEMVTVVKLSKLPGPLVALSGYSQSGLIISETCCEPEAISAVDGGGEGLSQRRQINSGRVLGHCKSKEISRFHHCHPKLGKKIKTKRKKKKK